MNAAQALWLRARALLARARADRGTTESATAPAHHDGAVASLRALLDDPQIPTSVRSGLAAEFARKPFRQLCVRIMHGHDGATHFLEPARHVCSHTPDTDKTNVHIFSF